MTTTSLNFHVGTPFAVNMCTCVCVCMCVCMYACEPQGIGGAYEVIKTRHVPQLFSCPLRMQL